MNANESSDHKARGLLKWFTPKEIATGVVIAVAAPLILAFMAFVWSQVSAYAEQRQRRIDIHREIEHRLKFASQVLQSDYQLAKKRLDAVDPTFAYYERYQGKRLIDLVDELVVLGDDAVDEETIDLASDPTLTADKVGKLIDRLNAGVPKREVRQESELLLEYLRVILDWPLVALILGIYGIRRFTAKP